MKRISIFIAGLYGGLTTVVIVALTYLGSRLASLPFIPFDIFDWMTRHLPGALINLTIDTMVRLITSLKLGPTASTAKLVENSIAFVQFIIAGVLLGVILGIAGRRRPDRLIAYGAIAGLVVTILMVFIEVTYRFPAAGPFFSILWLALVFIGEGAILGRLILEQAPQGAIASLQPEMTPPIQGSPSLVKSSTPSSTLRTSQPMLSRRQFLYLVGAGSFTVLVGAAGVRLLGQAKAVPLTGAPTPTPDLSNINIHSGPAASPPQSVLDARFKPVPGTRAELTTNGQFYRIDINSDPPVIDASTWRLQFEGLVDNPLSLSIDEISSRESMTQAVTMSCISNDIGGDLIGTTLWTGVPFKNILDEAELKPGVQAINIKAVDGFYESVPIQEAMDGRTMLVYKMNGQSLPVEHGFPLRIYIPNHYGMKQPKWITSMEASDHLGPGYWVDRGWSSTAYAQTTSVIDSVAVNDKDPNTGLVPVGGIAWAGARGISKVEVQVDDGPWDTAELRNPPLSPLTWVQWRYFWKSSSGYHTFKVRAYDGSGALQVTNPKPTFPDGATGIDEIAANLNN
jgi:DMSO/TMAO reductase YedYZ molybdopterin-dependent catalytic subunit